jgi:hypothetical protein
MPPPPARVPPGRVVYLIVLAGVVITSLTLGIILLGGPDQPVVRKAELLPAIPMPAIVPAPQKCGYMPTYPRQPGTCK